MKKKNYGNDQNHELKFLAVKQISCELVICTKLPNKKDKNDTSGNFYK